MRLFGYDASLEIGRSALNKLLGAVEKSPLWVGEFKGDQSNPSDSDKYGLTGRVRYHVRLFDIRVRPNNEQEAAIESSIVLLINVSGDALIELNSATESLLKYPVAIDGTVSVAVYFELTFDNHHHQLVVSFRNALVQVVRLYNLPDDLQRIMVNGLAFLLQEELRRQQHALPVTGLLKLSGSPQGNLSNLLLKTHFYRTEPDDSAVGLGIVFEPAAISGRQRRPLELRRFADQDLAVTVQEDYLNRLIANALNDPAFLSGGEVFGEKTSQQGFYVHSVALSIDGSRLRVVVRAGWKHTELSLQASLIPKMTGTRLTLEVTDVHTDLPTWRGDLLKLTLSVIIWALLGAADLIITGEVRKRLKPIEDQANSVAVESMVFPKPLTGLSVKVSPKSVRTSPGLITLGYALLVDWTK